jgi:hypothetical protein
MRLEAGSSELSREELEGMRKRLDNVTPAEIATLIEAAERGLVADELTQALERALDATENMAALPLPEDWREKLLEQYPNALRALRGGG